MLVEFKNLKQLVEKLSDEKACRNYYETIRWNGKPVCPHCGSERIYTFTPKGGAVTNLYKCANKDCKKKFNCLTGTIFENTKVPLIDWFKAIYIATSHKKGISSIQLGKDLGITQKTAWFILHRIREMLRENAPVMLENEVEIDETFIGGKEKNKHAHKKTKETQGRSVKTKTPVLGILERNGKIVVTPVLNTSAKCIQPIMVDTVKPGSTIYTDEWHGYNGLHKRFTHQVVQHSVGEYVVGACHTNTVEGFWSLLKRGIYGIYHNVSKKHLSKYCNEFAFRYNTRKFTESGRFDAALGQSVKRLKYEDLIRNGKE